MFIISFQAKNKPLHAVEVSMFMVQFQKLEIGILIILILKRMWVEYLDKNIVLYHLLYYLKLK